MQTVYLVKAWQRLDIDAPSETVIVAAFREYGVAEYYCRSRGFRVDDIEELRVFDSIAEKETPEPDAEPQCHQYVMKAETACFVKAK